MEDQELKTLIKTALLFIISYYVVLGIGLALILGVLAEHFKIPILIASLLAILSISVLIFFSFFYYKKYFSLNIFEQPLEICRFKSNIVKNLAIGLGLSLISTTMAIFVRKIINSSYHLVFNPKELLVLDKLIFQILYLGLIGPIVEEILLRGFFYRLGEKIRNARFSIIANVLLMMILHPSLDLFPGIVLFTIVVCNAYAKSRSLHKPITIHVSGNLMGLFLGNLIFPPNPNNLLKYL